MKDYPELLQLKKQKHKAPQNLLIRTENLMEQQLKDQAGGVKIKKNIWKILVPIIAATAILAVSVSAYALEWFAPQKPTNETHIPESTPEHIYEEDGTVLEQDNLQFTVLSTAADNQNMYMYIEVRTLDGSSLRPEGEYASSKLMWQRFNECTLKVNGANVWTAMYRLDDGSEADRILYEVYAYSSYDIFTNAENKEISLHLKDLADHKENNIVYYEGEWNIPVNLVGTERLAYSPQYDITMATGTVTIENISLSNLSMIVSGVYEGTGEIDADDVYLIFEDGTKQLADPKGSSGSLGHGEFKFEYIYGNIVDSQTVTALEFMGNRIDLQ